MEWVAISTSSTSIIQCLLQDCIACILANAPSSSICSKIGMEVSGQKKHYKSKSCHVKGKNREGLGEAAMVFLDKNVVQLS